MKRVILSVVSCLLIGTATAMAGNELVIHLKSGVTQRYVLLNEEPTISFSGDNIVVTTSSDELTYAMEDVSYFNYENNAATSISGVDAANGMRMNGDYLEFNGLPAGSKVFVYGSAGQTFLTATADETGHASVDLTSLARGVYIINANNVSTKITKK